MDAGWNQFAAEHGTVLFQPWIYLNYAVLNVFEKIYIIYASAFMLLADFEKLDTDYFLYWTI